MRENPFLKKGGFPTPFPQKLWVRDAEESGYLQIHAEACMKCKSIPTKYSKMQTYCSFAYVVFLFVAQMKSICYYFILQQLGRFVNPFCAKIWLRVNLAITNNPKITLVFDNINCHAKFVRPFSALRRLAKRIQAIVTCRNSAVQLALPSAQINANNCIIAKKMIQYS